MLCMHTDCREKLQALSCSGSGRGPLAPASISCMARAAKLASRWYMPAVN